MRAKTLRKLLAGLLGVALAVVPVQAGFAQAAPPLKIEMEVTDGGVNCLQGCQAVKYAADKWNYTISVEQGAQVELAFHWAHKGYFHDEHIFLLEGYGLEWEKINGEHKDATLKFVADKPGTFTLKCDLDCEVHDTLQRGNLKVARGGGGGAAAPLTPTKLTLTPSTWITAGEPVVVTATLKDNEGKPVPKADVEYYLNADFYGQVGAMRIGVAKTDANGVASMQYTPTSKGDKLEFIGRFTGKGALAESEEAIAVQQVGIPAGYVPAPIGLDNVRNWGHTGLAALILTIWATFGFVMFQAVGVSWSKRKKGDQRT